MLLASPMYGQELSPTEFITYLQSAHSDSARFVEWLRFHRCEYREKHGPPWQMRFAIVNTAPDPRTRAVLFDRAKDITDATGWYPLVMGRRVRKSRARTPSRLVDRATLQQLLGPGNAYRLESLQDLAGGNDGTSILCELTGGAIQLDFGHGFRDPLERPRFGILSHSHRDHSGGLQKAFGQKTPVIMSEGTFHHLRAMRVPLPTSLTLLVRPPMKFDLGEGQEVAFLPGAHTPGTMMVKLTDDAGNELLYPGDYCLQNRFFSQQVSDLLNVFNNDHRGQKNLLVDGTFLRHGPKSAVGLSATLDRLIYEANAAGVSLIVTSDDADRLYPVYLWFFKKYYVGSKTDRTGERPIFVGEQVLRLLEIIFDPFILRQLDRYDPLMREWAGQTQHNFLETVHLYPVAKRLADQLPQPSTAFLTTRELEENPWLLGQRHAVLTVGPTSASLRGHLEQSASWVDVLDGPDFTFHSSEIDVVAIVKHAIDSGITPILFHNFGGRVRKGLREHGLLAGFEMVGRNPVRLGPRSSHDDS